MADQENLEENQQENNMENNNSNVSEDALEQENNMEINNSNVPEDALQKVKQLSSSSYIVTPEEYMRNFVAGYTEGDQYIEEKNGYPFMPWGYVFYFISIHHPNLEIVNWEFEVMREKNILENLPCSGNSRQGYGVHYYLRNRETGLETHPFFYPIINYKNDPIKGDDLDSSLLNKAKMRAITKMVAKEIGLGMHLYMRMADIVDKDVSAATDKENYDKKEKLVDKIIKIQDKLQKYDEKYNKDLVRYSKEGLMNKEYQGINKIYNMQMKQGYVISIRKLLDQYEKEKGEKHELSEKNIEKMEYEDLEKEFKKLSKEVN